MKKEKNMKKIVSLLVMGCSFSAAWAQLDNTVEVTNEVKPVVTDVKKVNVQTKVAETPVKHYTMQYAVQSQPLSTFAPEPLGDYSSDAVLKGNKRGYLHLGAGNQGRLDAQFDYQLDFTDVDALNIDFTLKGHSGHVADNKYYGPAGRKARDYQNFTQLKYNHRFDNGADFYVKGQFENRVFNYLPRGGHDKQHDVLAGFTAGLTPYRFGQLTVEAAAGVDFFSQNHKTNLSDNLGETYFHVDGTATYKMADQHSLGLGLQFVNTSYGNRELDGITRLRLAPHYIYNTDLFNLQLGVFVSTKGNVAPDVAFAYHLNPKSDVYVEARGYETDNTFRFLSNLHPYFIFTNAMVGTMGTYKMEAEFHQIDVRAGYRFNSANGFSGNIFAGYDYSKDAADTDWITNAVNGLYYPIIDFPRTRRFYVNADFAYAYKDVVKIDARNRLNFESCEENDEWISGSYTSPILGMLWTADFKLVKDLYLGLNWEYAVYSTPEIDVIPGPAYDRPTTVNLGASLRYTLPVTLPLSVFVKGDNLLNKNYDRYFGYRSWGTTFLAGFALSF